MMGRRVQIEKDIASVLEFYPPEGRPDVDSTSLYVYTSGTTTLDATLDPLTITLDDVNEALTVAAAKGDTTLTMADASDVVVGRRYTLVNELGQIQPFTAIAASSTVVTMDQPVRFASTVTNSTLAGHRLPGAISAAINDSLRRNMRALWQYDIGGVTIRRQYFFDSVLQPFVLHITEEDVEQKDPRFGEAIGSRRGWEKLREGAIDDAWDALADMQVRPDLVRSRHLVKTAAIYNLLAQFYRSLPSERDHWSELYRRTWTRFEHSKAWYDSDEDFVASWGGMTTIKIGDDTVTVNGTSTGGRAAEDAGLPVRYARVG